LKRVALIGLLMLLARPASAGPGPAPAPAPPPPEPTFPIAITVALENGVPARDDAWINAQIADASALYDPLGVHFRWTLRKEMASAHAQMHSRDDRDALAELVERNVIDVFVVAALEDVDEPGRYRKGVAWTSKPTNKRFIILSGAAPPTVLAHELGHFFGNGHSDVPNNLMSYARTGKRVFLDETQIERIHLFSSRFLTSGRLPDVGPPRFLP
jgi:hypothetical protein